MPLPLPPPVDILSDSDDAFSPVIPPKSRIRPPSPILLLDDTPPPPKPSIIPPSFVPETPVGFGSGVSFVAETPVESGSGVSFVAETPVEFGSGVSLVPCSVERVGSKPGCSDEKFSGGNGVIFLESDDDDEGEDEDGFELSKKDIGRFSFDKKESLPVFSKGGSSSKDESTSFDPHSYIVGTSDKFQLDENEYNNDVLSDDFSTEINRGVSEEKNSTQEEISLIKASTDVISDKNELKANKKRQSKEEKAKLVEERKRKRQEEKLEREAKKAESKEMKKMEKEKQKWEKGKLALKSIVAQIDSQVIESGMLGGHILTRFAEKGFSYKITKNPIQNSILWKMEVPDEVAQSSSVGTEVQYILIVLQAEEFCDLVNNNLLMDHLSKVQNQYPCYIICYVTNKLMSYIKKREQSHYKNPSSCSTWRPPHVDEVISKLCTHYKQVHSRHCIDESELAEHIVGLTSSLANCQFRKKLTWLSINANGLVVPKDATERNLIKKNTWLKALVAIPKVQPRHAIAIWKKYPTMRSLLNVYMDQTKSVHEKGFLLKDLMMEGILGNGERRLGEVCSKRVYRILTAQSGGIKTDDVENGADFF